MKVQLWGSGLVGCCCWWAQLPDRISTVMLIIFWQWWGRERNFALNTCIFSHISHYIYRVIIEWKVFVTSIGLWWGGEMNHPLPIVHTFSYILSAVSRLRKKENKGGVNKKLLVTSLSNWAASNHHQHHHRPVSQIYCIKYMGNDGKYS